MPKFVAVSRNAHADKHWKRFASYAFAHNDHLVALVAAEFPRAALAFPIAFVAQGEAVLPVAVLGLMPGKNLFVAPDGRWLGGYIPSAYRGYPFQLLNSENDQQVLCIDEESGLIEDGPGQDGAGEGATNGEPFFNEAGEPSKAVADVLDFLSQVGANRAATAKLCAVLQAHGLIVPWKITLKDAGGERQIDGLLQIDEAALNTLPADAFQELRAAGALPLIYSHLLSTQHLQTLGKLAEAWSQHQPAPDLLAPGGELDLEFLNDSETIRFGSLH